MLSLVLPRDENGVALDAEFSVVRDGGHLDLILESAHGASAGQSARNRDYRRALSVMLTRLHDLDAVIEDAVVDSRFTQRAGLGESERRLIDAPVRVAHVHDLEALRLKLTSKQVRIGQAPNVSKGGNSTKRIRLRLSVPGYAASDADRLASHIATPALARAAMIDGANGSAASAAAASALAEAPIDAVLRAPISDARPIAQDRPVEDVNTLTYETAGAEGSMRSRSEHDLVRRYADWLSASGIKVVSRLYCVPGLTWPFLCDVFLPSRNALVEAKSSDRREAIRMAVGQLLDYQYLEGTRSRFGVLLPYAPAPEIRALLDAIGIGVVWPFGDGFRDSAGGTFTNT